MVESFSGVFELLSESGGYALIVGLQIVLPFILALFFLQWYMKDRTRRMDARELMERTLSQEREAQLRRDYEEQLARERMTQDMVARMNDRYDATLNKVTEAFGENSAVLRQAKLEIRRNSEAMDRNTELLQRFVPSLPKRASRRKPTAVVERTVTVETKAAAEVEAKGDEDG